MVEGSEQRRVAQRRLGQRLAGKWKIERLLGLGGMSSVYEAIHSNGYRAAIKILHAELSGHPVVRARFRREGYLANRVEHAGVVRVIDDLEEDDGTLALVMELLEGETLEARWISSARRMPVSEVVPIADRVLEVLAAAHAKGIVHRDLKPSNVFLCRSGEIKILDFGIASSRHLGADAAITESGVSMGTPCFMARELARGLRDEVDAQSDLWAVGATLFALLSGRYVFEGRSSNEVLIAAATQAPVSLRTVASGAPAAIAAVIDRALRVEKSERWPDAQAMRQALCEALGASDLAEANAPDTLVANLPLVSAPSRDAARGRGGRGARWLAAAAIALAAIAVGLAPSSGAGPRMSASPHGSVEPLASSAAPAEHLEPLAREPAPPAAEIAPAGPPASSVRSADKVKTGVAKSRPEAPASNARAVHAAQSEESELLDRWR